MAEQAFRRVFFALLPSAAALDELELLTKAAMECCGGRCMRRDTLHLTLLFLGNVSERRLPMLVQAAGQVRTDDFEVILDWLGWWPHNRILWMGCHSVLSPHRRLFDALVGEMAQAGFSCDARSYHPHVTLVRDARCVDTLPPCRTVGWRAYEFCLVESLLQATGARYRILERWSLNSASGAGTIDIPIP